MERKPQERKTTLFDGEEKEQEKRAQKGVSWDWL